MDDKNQRLPAGQRLTEDWPILHYGSIPNINLDEWVFNINGLVKEPLSFTWNEFMEMPQTKVTSDIHCVTTWSKYDNEWEGVLLKDIFKLIQP